MIALVLLAAFAVLVLVAAAYDVWTMRIPNWISLALALLFPAYALTAGLPDLVVYHAAPAAVVFSAGLALFALGKFGGGDVKLLTVVTLWIGLNGLPIFLFALAGFGLVSIGVFVGLHKPLSALAARWFDRPGFAVPVSLQQSGEIPYGTVIAAAALTAVALSAPPF